MCVSSVSFAIEGTENEEKEFKWVATEEQLVIINQMNKEGKNYDEILQIVNPKLFKELKKAYPEYVKSLKYNLIDKLKENDNSANTDVTTRAGNPVKTSYYRIQEQSMYNSIFASGTSVSASGEQPLSLLVSVVDTEYTSLAHSFDIVASAHSITESFACTQDDGTYRVQTIHGFGYLDGGNLEFFHWPSSTDWFDYTYY
jgi:hypothetical protein